MDKTAVDPRHQIRQGDRIVVRLPNCTYSKPGTVIECAGTEWVQVDFDGDGPMAEPVRREDARPGF